MIYKMILSKKAQEIFAAIDKGCKLGDLRVHAKEIKKDHELACELWSTEKLYARLLAILIMDGKELNDKVVLDFIKDIEQHEYDERLQLADWFMANQLTKNKKIVALIESWENSDSAIQRRIFWYYQGRLRWVGQTPPGNTDLLLSAIEEKMLHELPEVQWAMNFTAGWIGVFDRANRGKCVDIGQKLGLYEDEVVAKGCSPNYLPKFIELETKKRNLE